MATSVPLLGEDKEEFMDNNANDNGLSLSQWNLLQLSAMWGSIDVLCWNMYNCLWLFYRSQY